MSTPVPILKADDLVRGTSGINVDGTEDIQVECCDALETAKSMVNHLLVKIDEF